MFQVPQHFRPSKMQASGGGCFARWSISPIISLEFGMSGTVHPRSLRRWGLNTETGQSGLPSTFNLDSKLNESVRMTVCVVWLSPLEAVQRKVGESGSISIVKLKVET